MAPPVFRAKKLAELHTGSKKGTHLMGKHCNTNGGHSPEYINPKQHQAERVNFVSEDGLVEIATTPGKKYPQHEYKVVVLRLRPQPGTRVLRLDDGSCGVEILMTHVEVAEHLRALNAADGKAQYRWREIPEKPRYRREFWRRINDQRHGRC